MQPGDFVEIYFDGLEDGQNPILCLVLQINCIKKSPKTKSQFGLNGPN
jgi:hypothetical protein